MSQLALYPQEKIHLHTDRDFYLPGEKIWFKAYVADAATHEHATNSRYVYVELINSHDSLFRRVMIRPVDNMFYGDIFLPEMAVEGNYTLRAYTRYMENLGDDYFFKKNIQIGTLSYDNKQPAKQFELPLSDSQTCLLTVSRKDKKVLIGIQKSVDSPDIPRYLLVHCRGLILYFSACDETKILRFAEEQLPSGVIHCILFDEQMNSLSERLVFINNKEDVIVGFETDKTFYEKRENIIVTLSLTDSDGNPLTGHLSVAVTNDKDLPLDSSTTILSSLLLSSELKGYIENPAFYLRDNTESAIALDNLMMTRGWERYNIQESVKGNFEYPQIQYQTSQEISGVVKTSLLFKPAPDCQISVMVQNGAFGIIHTDEKGRFLFRDFEYPDSTSYYIQALSKNGSNEVVLDVDRESFPSLIHAPQSLVTGIPVIKKEMEGKSRYDDDMWTLNIIDAVATAPRVDRKDEPRLRFPLNRGSDVTIRREEFEKAVPRSLLDVISKVPGVRIDYRENKIYLGKGTAGLPLVILDGAPIHGLGLFESLEFIPVFNVASIDVFNGPSAYIFGVRGADGVISITTGTGEGEEYLEREKLNYVAYTPLGYQKRVEFSTLDSRTTIFWKPDVVISDRGEARFEFYASDFPTTYSVVLEGITTDGRIIRRVEKIRVGDVSPLKER